MQRGPLSWRPAAGSRAALRALIDAIHALEAGEPAALAAVFRDHDSELLGWP